MPFTERSPLESGFAKVFDEKLAPELDRLEARRQELLAGARRQVGIALAVGVVAGVLLAMSAGSEGWAGLLLGLGVPTAIGAGVALILWRRQAGKWEGEMARTVMPVVCGFIGDLDYDREAMGGFPLQRAQKLGVIGSFTDARLTDRLEGRYRDTPFELVEAKLTSKSRSRGKDESSNTTTVFDGLLFRIGVPEPVAAPILIARDYTSVGNKLAEMLSFGSGRGSMPKVELSHERFESHFEVYSRDPDAARALLAPGFLDNLMEIGDSEGGQSGLRGLQAGFSEDSFFLALWREGDFLAMGSLSRPATGIEADLHAVFDDIALVRRIIDRLHGDAPRDAATA